MQSRLYSTERSNDDPPPSGSESQKEPTTPGSRLASTLGFQSLSGLLQEPVRGRYSRPRRPEVTEAPPPPKSDPKPESPSTVPFSDEQIKGSQGFFTPADSTASHQPKEDQKDSPVTYQRTRRVDGPQDVKIRRTDSTPKYLRRSRALPAGSSTRGASRQPSPRTRTNPFASKSPAVKPSRPPRSSQSTAVNSEPAWGLSREDEASINSFLEPGSVRTEYMPQDETISPAKDQSTMTQPSVNNRAASKPRQPIASTQPPQNESNKLTHVTATGEAHMVDVGEKSSTKRTAIAFSSVRFTNPEPFRLIFENTNKKGDVLGVARIAGIMAAKRTSDLIPLCHPISISKVEVDLRLLAPARISAVFDGASRQGCVVIQAQVECTGPTGVEMEALTAASAAALTVYDMCKAVDRNMFIERNRVVYKSGGKSGLHYHKLWIKTVGPQFLGERGLQAPQFLAELGLQTPAAED